MSNASSDIAPKQVTVLVTGFGPWVGFPVNESSVCVQKLWDLDWPANVKLITRELPVVYDIVTNEVPKLWSDFKPDLVIHCGISGQATSICIEKQSFNRDYDRIDIHNKCPSQLCCLANGEDLLQTKLDTVQLCSDTNKFCQANGLQAECTESHDPGQYLCGFTYYLSLSKDPTKTLFVHIPTSHVYSVEEKTLVLKEIILNCLKQLNV